MCRSRRELSNAYFLAEFGFDTAENEPCQVCPIEHTCVARLPPSQTAQQVEGVAEFDGTREQLALGNAKLLADLKAAPDAFVEDFALARANLQETVYYYYQSKNLRYRFRRRLSWANS